MSAFASLFGGVKPILGMIHLPPLPGSPQGGELAAALERAHSDASALIEAGVDGLIVENFGDSPFARTRVPAATVASMGVIVAELVREHNVAIGVNVLRNDAEAALSIATVTGAEFIRVNVHIGAVVADQGIIQGQARETLMLRQALGSSALLFADLRVKHASPLGEPADLVDEAKNTFGRGAADALILSGVATGAAADASEFARVKEALPTAPLLVGSGASQDNLREFWPVADGMIVGSSLKFEGNALQPVDPDRARAFLREVSQLRREAGGP